MSRITPEPGAWTRALFIVAALICAAITVASPAHAAPKSKPDPVTHVYFIRGFLNVFSTGFDDMAKKLGARGVKAAVYGHLSGASVRSRILADVKTTGRKPNPVIIVGHSFGGNAAFAVAKSLAADGVAVDLVITVDPTHAGPLSPNVKRYVNYYFPANGLGAAIPGGGKRVRNVDLKARADVAGVGDDHWTVTTNAALTKEILSTILRQLGRR
jgi:Thioesterase domains of type I polyketide synthases or non-ribosomal peptide synthetases